MIGGSGHRAHHAVTGHTDRRHAAAGQVTVVVRWLVTSATHTVMISSRPKCHSATVISTQPHCPRILKHKKIGSFERINSLRETNGNFDSCNSCKRLGTSRLFIRSNLSVRNFRIFLLMYTGAVSRLVTRRLHRSGTPSSAVITIRDTSPAPPRPDLTLTLTQASCTVTGGQAMAGRDRYCTSR